MLRSLCMIVSDQFEENSLFVEESVETSVKILLNRCFVRCILVTDACADRGRARHDAALALYGDYMYELMTTQQVEEDLQAAKPFTIATSSMVLERSLNSVQDYREFETFIRAVYYLLNSIARQTSLEIREFTLPGPGQC
jgi:hypothetical protein